MIPHLHSLPAQSSSYEGRRLPWPTEWHDLFDRSAPLVMEIGFGGGHFLLALAKQHPDWNVLGIENSHHCLWDVEKRLPRLGYTNVKLIHAEAQMVLAYVCPTASIDKLYINFPDPYPKTAHAARRLLSPGTLALIAARLKPGALLTIATDVEAYAESIAQNLAVTPGLVNRHANPWLNVLPGRTVTRYERKAQDRGATCFYFEWERDPLSETPPLNLPDQPEKTETDPMPNIVLQSPLSLEQIADAFQTVEFKHEDVHVRLVSLYQNRNEPGLLIDSFIDEPLLDQRPGIAIVSHADQPGRYVIRLSLIGYPRPTRGTHIAVKKVADWVRSLHPDTQVLYEHTAVKDMDEL